MDFTLQKYAEICAALVEADYCGICIGDYLSGNAPAGKIVLLRHDVDSRPMHAVKMAEIEQTHGLSATYYFRMVGRAFEEDAIRKISVLGHEVGYHYETLAQTRGNIHQAVDLFRTELARLREIAVVRTASMHGSPLSKWDNRAIWENVKPQDFDLVGEVYLDIDYAIVTYLSDTGRSWHPTRYNLRDIAAVPATYTAETTDDLIALIGSGEIQTLCLLTHPERWQDDIFNWSVQWLRDTATNTAKVGLKALYARR